MRRRTVVVAVEEPVAVDNTDWEEARCRMVAVAAGVVGSIHPSLFALASSALLLSPGWYLLTAVTRVRHGASGSGLRGLFARVVV